MKNSRWLAVIVVLQGLILGSLWSGNRSVTTAAYAGDVPNPAQRQMELLDEIKTTNTKLDQIIGILSGGDLQVKVVQSDDNKGPARRR